MRGRRMDPHGYVNGVKSKSQMTRNQFRDGNETRLQNYLRDTFRRTIEQALGASSVSGSVSRSIEKVF